ASLESVEEVVDGEAVTVHERDELRERDAAGEGPRHRYLRDHELGVAQERGAALDDAVFVALGVDLQPERTLPAPLGAEGIERRDLDLAPLERLVLLGGPPL